jgi:hypothetical protein
MQGAYKLKLGMNVEAYEWKVYMVKRTSNDNEYMWSTWEKFPFPKCIWRVGTLHFFFPNIFFFMFVAWLFSL